MQKVVNELDPNGSGDMVTRFVRINNEMRRANNKTLAELRFKTADHFLWSQPFIRQSHSQSEATFADLRNYIYQGKKIDTQVHLGYDLAVTPAHRRPGFERRPHRLRRAARYLWQLRRRRPWLWIADHLRPHEPDQRA